MARTEAPSSRGLLLSEYVTSLVRPDAPIPGPALPEVAVLGRSNVGKSSLLNGLVGRRALARTSRTPGKTRMLNVYRWGDRCYLVDVPGYGWARAGAGERAAWRRLVERYIEIRRTLTGVVWLLDIRRDPSPDDLAIGERLAARGVPTLVVLTKADQVARGHRADRAASIRRHFPRLGPEFIVTSARRGEGMEDLRESVLAFLG